MTSAWQAAGVCNEHRLVLLALADGSNIEDIPARFGYTQEHADRIIRELEHVGALRVVDECCWFWSGSTWIDRNGRRRRDLGR